MRHSTKTELEFTVWDALDDELFELELPVEIEFDLVGPTRRATHTRPAQWPEVEFVSAEFVGGMARADAVAYDISRRRLQDTAAAWLQTHADRVLEEVME